jgi:hypothetical protein
LEGKAGLFTNYLKKGKVPCFGIFYWVNERKHINYLFFSSHPSPLAVSFCFSEQL